MTQKGAEIQEIQKNIYIFPSSRFTFLFASLIIIYMTLHGALQEIHFLL